MSGTLFIVAAPSGAGKSSLLKALMESIGSDSRLRVSVSHTTRAPRPGEQDGVDYNFVDVDEFEEMLASGSFLEYARVFDNFYGTSLKWVQQQLAEDINVILEIDWQGARRVREVFPAVVSVFILPPSRDELEKRLRSRGQDDEDIIARRMSDAEAGMSHYPEFDYLVINDDFDQALQELRLITTNRGQADHLRLENQKNLRQAMLGEIAPSG
ncbi:MAG: guanylate kinase [Gammaproteobacteria bacterium]|nr:MAG: guanylate kinase [Gammaproteobacteria bacterium]